jgi:hypothetical protein
LACSLLPSLEFINLSPEFFIFISESLILILQGMDLSGRPGIYTIHLPRIILLFIILRC